MPFIIGRKIEMTQQFKEDGTVVPVTLVKAEPNVVAFVRTHSLMLSAGSLPPCVWEYSGG